MTLIEFIGFVFSLVAMIFLFIKRLREENQQRRRSEIDSEEHSEQEHALDQFMKSLGVEKKRHHQEWDEEDDEEEQLRVAKSRRLSMPPPPPQKVVKSHTPMRHGHKQKPIHSSTGFSGELLNTDQFLKSSLEDSYHEAIVSKKFLEKESKAYDLVKSRPSPSRAATALRRLPSSKEMVIMKEVFGPPKCMQVNPWDD